MEQVFPTDICPLPVKRPLRPQNHTPGGSLELESDRWPLNPAPVFCPWELGNPGPHGDPSHKETDPFQMVDELTAQDVQWRTTIRVASQGLEDVQEFFRLSLEALGSSSRVGRSVLTRGRASQTRV